MRSVAKRRGRGALARLGLAATVCALAVPTQAGAQDRAYELVSPPGSDAVEWEFQTADADASHVYFQGGVGSVEPSYVPPDGGGIDGFAATRTASGWQVDWITPYCNGDPFILDGFGECTGPRNQRGTAQGKQIDYASDGRALFKTIDPIDPTDDNHVTTGLGFDWYIASADGMSWLSPDMFTPNGTDVNNITATDDLRTVLFTSDRTLLPEDQNPTANQHDIYVVRDGQLEMVAPTDCACSEPYVGNPDSNWMSSDGSRIFFHSWRPYDTDTDPALDTFVWEDGQIRHLSPSVEEDEWAFFEGATPDGEYAFIKAYYQLVPEDTDGNYDVYRVNVDDPTDRQLVSGAGQDIEVQYMTATPDASTVYFLTPEAFDDAPDNGKNKLYAWSAATDEISYIYTSIPAHSQNKDGDNWHEPRKDLQGVAVGDSLYFDTDVPILAADQNDVKDVYRWSAQGGVELISERLPGPQSGHAEMRPRYFAGTGERYEPGMIEDGSQIFFQATASLLPEDTDGGLTDVYAWTEQGGLEMISPPGGGQYTALYRGNSPDGTDVFIVTDEPLAPVDTDGGEPDVYDARIGGGFEYELPPEGDLGKDPIDPGPKGGPDGTAPTSGSFVGDGDPDARPRPVFTLGKLTKAQRARLARGRKVPVRVRVNQAGRVSLVVRARLKGSTRIVARRSVRADQAGTVRLPLRLPASARQPLSAGKVLRLRLTIAFADGRRSATVRLRLPENKRRSHNGR